MLQISTLQVFEAVQQQILFVVENVIKCPDANLQAFEKLENFENRLRFDETIVTRVWRVF